MDKCYICKSSCEKHIDFDYYYINCPNCVQYVFTDIDIYKLLNISNYKYDLNKLKAYIASHKANDQGLFLGEREKYNVFIERTNKTFYKLVTPEDVENWYKSYTVIN